MENTQLPVEWLVQELKNSNYYRGLKNIGITHKAIIEQAKQKEQEQKQELLVGFLYWFSKVAANNPMAFETDHDDIASMYLNGFYPECKKPEHNE